MQSEIVLKNNSKNFDLTRLEYIVNLVLEKKVISEVEIMRKLNISGSVLQQLRRLVLQLGDGTIIYKKGLFSLVGKEGEN